MSWETDAKHILRMLDDFDKRLKFQERLETPVIGEFSPTDIASILLWYDYGDYHRLFVDAGITRVFSNSAAIYRVQDKSGNDDHANQSTSSARPAYTQILNDLSAALFDGSSDYMIGPTNVDFSRGFSVFAVIRPTDARTEMVVSIYDSVDAGTQNRLQFYVASDGSVVCRPHQNADGGGVYIGRKSDASQIAANLTYLLEGHYDGGALASGIDIFLNGSEIDTTDDNNGSFSAVPATSNVPLRIGCQFSGSISVPWKGYIMDLIIFSDEISDANKTLMRTYLNDKWGIY